LVETHIASMPNTDGHPSSCAMPTATAQPQLGAGALFQQHRAARCCSQSMSIARNRARTHISSRRRRCTKPYVPARSPRILGITLNWVVGQPEPRRTEPACLSGATSGCRAGLGAQLAALGERYDHRKQAGVRTEEQTGAEQQRSGRHLSLSLCPHGQTGRGPCRYFRIRTCHVPTLRAAASICAARSSSIPRRSASAARNACSSSISGSTATRAAV